MRETPALSASSPVLHAPCEPNEARFHKMISSFPKSCSRDRFRGPFSQVRLCAGHALETATIRSAISLHMFPASHPLPACRADEPRQAAGGKHSSGEAAPESKAPSFSAPPTPSQSPYRPYGRDRLPAVEFPERRDPPYAVPPVSYRFDCYCPTRPV